MSFGHLTASCRMVLVLSFVLGCGGQTETPTPRPPTASPPTASATTSALPTDPCATTEAATVHFEASAEPPDEGFFPGAGGEDDELNEDESDPVPINPDGVPLEFAPGPLLPAPGAANPPAPENIVSYGDIYTFTHSENSPTAEPNVAVNGDRVLMTWNKLAAASTDRGRTFEFLYPKSTDQFAFADGGFCCDQLAAYVGSHGLWLWVLQYESGTDGRNRIRLAAARSDEEFDNHDYHYWDFRPQDAGLPEGASYDQTKLGVSAGHVYLSINIAGADNKIRQAIVIRVPLDELAGGGRLTPACFLGRTTDGAPARSLRPLQQAGQTMYLGTHVDNATMGVWAWADAASDPTYYKVTHKTSKGRADGTYHCPLTDSPESGANDWCSRPGRGGGTANDERLTAAWLADGKLGFAWNAGQDRPNHPFPWVNAILVDVDDLPICSIGVCGVAYPWLASSTQAVQYATITTNGRGEVGGVFLYGGGATNLSCGGVLSDAYTEANEGYWSIGSLASSTREPLNSSGDYLGIWPDGGNDRTWSGACMTHRADGPSTSVHYIRFGRQLNDPGN